MTKSKTEKITAIQEIQDVTLQDCLPKNHNKTSSGIDKTKYDGYCIKTDQHVYFLLITNDTICQETYGYFSNEDDITQFIGKELHDIKISDTSLNTITMNEKLPCDLDRGGIQFIDLLFSDGSICQFAVYNGHNGYYGHNILFIKDQTIILDNEL